MARKPAVIIALLLALGTAAVYLPVLSSDFTNYDDPSYILENPPVRMGLTWSGFGWAFTHFHSGNWHPLTWLSHMLDCQLFGLQPAGHHLVNLFLHISNSILLFLVLRSITEMLFRSALIAAFFALHPLHVESVAWVSERKDVLSTFFFLLTLISYVAYARSATAQVRSAGPESSPRSSPFALRTCYYLLSLLLFALGLMSKPMLVTLPFVLLLLDYWPLGRMSDVRCPTSNNTDHAPHKEPQITTILAPRPSPLALVTEKLPFLLLSAASCAITFVAQHQAGAMAGLQSVPLPSRLLNAVISYASYLSKTIWPTRLSIIYPLNLHWTAPQVVLPAVTLLAFSTLALWQWRARPYLVVGWAWFIGTLVPVIGLVQVGSQSMADRYMYIPSIGLFLMFIWGLAELRPFRHKDWPKLSVPALVGGEPKTALPLTPFSSALLGLIIITTLGCCAALTRTQLEYWKNTETLFRHALAVTSNNALALNSLGFFYAEQTNAAAAQECFEASVRINPANPFTWNGLAKVSLLNSNPQQAIAECQQALQLDPRLPEVHAALGMALMKIGKTDDAISQYSQAITLRPDFADAHYNLANALTSRGQFEQALQQYQAAARLDPQSADAHNNLAYLLARVGQLDQAVAEFRAALAIRPNLWQAHYGLAEALSKKANFAEAVGQYRETLQAQPDLVEALNRLAWLLATSPQPQLRNGTEALELAERAAKLTGYKQSGILLTLAAAAAEAGKFPDAIHAAEQARELALASNKPDLARRAEHLLELFRDSKPYHEPAPL